MYNRVTTRLLTYCIITALYSISAVYAAPAKGFTPYRSNQQHITPEVADKLGSRYASLSAGVCIRRTATYNDPNYEDLDGGTPTGSFMSTVGLGLFSKGAFRSELSLHGSRLHYSGTSIITQNGLLYFVRGSWSIKSYAMMLNEYYDFPMHGVIRPYLVAGIGGVYNTGDYSRILARVKDTCKDKDMLNLFLGKRRFSLAWSGGIGTQLRISPLVSLDISARHFYYGKAVAKNTDTTAGGAAIDHRVKGSFVSLGLVRKF